MSIKVVVSRKFELEACHHKNFIESDRQGYGEKFANEIEKAIQHIKSHPEAWSESKRGIRNIHLDIFKYHVIRYRYNKDKNLATILRLSHSARIS